MINFGKLSIRWKLIIAFALVSAIPLLAMGVATYLSSRVTIQNQVGLSYEQNLNQLSKTLDSELDKVEKLSTLILLEADFIANLKASQNGSAYEKLKAARVIEEQLVAMRFSAPSVNRMMIVSLRGAPIFTGKTVVTREQSYFGSAEFWESPLYQEVVALHGQVLWRRGAGDSETGLYVLRQIIDPDTLENLGVLVLSVDPDALQSIANTAVDRTLGDIFIVDENLLVVSHNDRAVVGSSLAEKYANDAFSGTHTGRLVDGRQLLVFSSMQNGWRIFLEIPLSSLLRGMDIVVLWVGIAMVTLAGMIVVVSVLISNGFSRGIQQLVTSTKEIAAGNLEYPIEVGQQDEIGILSASVLTMRDAIRDKIVDLETLNRELDHRVERRTAELAQANLEISHLNEQLKADNLRMGAELEVTKRLQQMLLPDQAELDQVNDLDITAFMEPADEVGGDYYDVLQHDGQLKIGIGDVTGHGLESGMVMLMAQTAVRTLLISGERDLGRLLDIINRTLYANIKRMGVERNLTLALLDYAWNMDKRIGELKLSGQHEDVLLIRKGGAIERLDTIDIGFPLGLVPEIFKFVGEMAMELHVGDGVVLYSDGITEAENDNGEFYGQTRLCDVVSANWARSAEEIKQAIVRDVREFIGEQVVYDDLTLVVLKQR